MHGTTSLKPVNVMWTYNTCWRHSTQPSTQYFSRTLEHFENIDFELFQFFCKYFGLNFVAIPVLLPLESAITSARSWLQYWLPMRVINGYLREIRNLFTTRNLSLSPAKSTATHLKFVVIMKLYKVDSNTFYLLD